MSLEDYQTLAAEAIGCRLHDYNAKEDRDRDPTDSRRVFLSLGSVLPLSNDTAVINITNKRQQFLTDIIGEFYNNLPDNFEAKNGAYIDKNLLPIFKKNFLFTYKEYLLIYSKLPELQRNIIDTEKTKKALMKMDSLEGEEWRRKSNSLFGIRKEELPLAQKYQKKQESLEYDVYSLLEKRKSSFGEEGELLAMAMLNSPDKYTDDIQGYINYIYSRRRDFYDKVLAHSVPVLIPEKNRMRHTYITGGSGSGKSELLRLIAREYALSNKDYCAAVIVEPHGDLAEQVAKFRCFAAGSSRLVYIDPNLREGYSPSFNPLTLPSGANPDVYAQQLLSVFEQLLEGGGDKSLTLNMQALLLPCLKVLVEYEGATLLDLHRMMQDDERSKKYIELGKQSRNAITSDFFSYEFHSTKWSPTKNAISTKISSLLNTETEQALFLNESTFNLEDIIENRRTLVLKFSKGRVGELSAKTFGRFIIAALQGLAMRRADLPEDKRVPVHLIVDECQNYITKDIENILQETRKYKLYATLCQQIYGIGMSTELKRIILGNCKMKMVGQNGDNETHSAMAQSMNVDESFFKDLGVGEFVTKIGENEPFTLFVNDFLIGTDGIFQQSPEEWQKTVSYQIATYYRSNDGNGEPEGYAEPEEKGAEPIDDMEF